MDKGILYLISTPIGNTGDISKRAIEILRHVDLVLCEDTRHSGRLLKKLGIDNKLMSYHDHNEVQRSQQVIDMLGEGRSIGLISDAGSPCISDPGSILVDQAHKHQIPISVIPGPNATISAVSASGFTSKRFQFLGFLPKKKGQKDKIIEETINYPGLSVFYESPKRLMDSLERINKICPDREVLVAREMTKLNEEYFRGSARQALDRFEPGARGEIVLVLDEYLIEKDLDLEKELKDKINDGYSRSQSVKLIAEEYGISKNDLYDISINLTNDD